MRLRTMDTRQLPIRWNWSDMEKIAKTPTNDGLLGLLGAPPPPRLYSPAPVSSMVARPSATPTPTLLALEDIKEDELPQAQQQEDGWEEVMFF